MTNFIYGAVFGFVVSTACYVIAHVLAQRSMAWTLDVARQVCPDEAREAFRMDLTPEEIAEAEADESLKNLKASDIPRPKLR